MTSAEEPELDRESAWEDVVEVSVHFPRGHIQLLTVYLDTIPGAPVVSIAGPGWYRLRVYARGRRYKEVADEISEHFQIHVWASGYREEIVYKATDPVGEVNRKMIAGEL